MGDLSEHFSKSEFECKCGCGFDDINPNLIARLELIREAVGFQFIIESGCRCRKHNTACGGKADSAHLTGDAADIRVTGSSSRYLFLKHAMRLFARIGIYDTFIHVDVNNLLPQYVTWLCQ